MVTIADSLISMQVTSFDGLLYCVCTIVVLMESKCIDILLSIHFALIKGMHATTINMQHDIISQLELNWGLWANKQRERSLMRNNSSSMLQSWTRWRMLLQLCSRLHQQWRRPRPAWQKVWLLLNLGKSILGLQTGLNRSEFGWAAVVDLLL